MTVEVDRPNPAPRLFAASPWLTRAALVLIFAAGLLVRLYDFGDAPLDFHGTRQMHSAMIARGMYYQNLASIPAWQRDAAVAQWHAEGLIEPQIMETLAAFGYRLAGSDQLWIPRLLAILFWLIGGIAVYLLGRDLTDRNGGVAAAVFYVALQYGVIASRSFQPDPLLVAAIVWALWAILRWMRNPTWRWAVLAGLLGGLAIYVKSTAVFFIAGAWLGVMLYGVGIGKAVRNPRVWVMTLLTVLPYAAFHLYGTLGLHLLESQFSLRFFPQMWIDPVFYLQWKNMIDSVVTIPWLLVGLIGIFLIRDKTARGLIGGAFAGYLIYGILFSYYTTTHNYYQLPLIPLVGLGLGAAFSLVVGQLRGPRWLAGALMSGVLLVFAASNLWDARTELKRTNYQQEVALAEQIGALFKPEDRVVSIAPYYSYSIRYWGWVNASNWLSIGDIALRERAGQTIDLKGLFEEQTKGQDYFLVMDFDEFDKQPEIKQILEQGYRQVANTPNYVLYDLNQPLQVQK